MTEKVTMQIHKDQYSLYCGDCCKVIKGIPDESVGFSVFSPPFASLYSYSDSKEDMGNCQSYDDFFVHFGFLVKHLHRVLLPGRIIAVHCMDIPTHKSKDDYIGLSDFPGDIVRAFREKGFIFHSRHCIWKDPLTAATRSHALGLAHKQIVKDSSMCRMGICDQILAFRKDGKNPEPIRHPMGLTEYCGERAIPSYLARFHNHDEPKTNKRSHWIWQQYASPVWDDIRQTRVLSYKAGKEKDDQRHLCPLQLDVVERCLVLWSNPGDVVLTPFMGVGTEVYVSAKMGRKGVGIELKKSYFRQAQRNMESLDKKQKIVAETLL